MGLSFFVSHFGGRQEVWSPVCDVSIEGEHFSDFDIKDQREEAPPHFPPRLFFFLLFHSILPLFDYSKLIYLDTESVESLSVVI